mmetsp:Transcript_5009/g.6093  ORF Transcript_5009/g.6093 Transcript_5009/m.6093 type:complete len:154 (+) Transcript_5009:231-692(+)
MAAQSSENQENSASVDYVAEMNALLAEQKRTWAAFFGKIPNPEKRAELMHRLYLDGFRQWFETWRDSDGVQEEQPSTSEVYVNRKQYHRILKRREERMRLEARIKRSNENAGKSYRHESRSKHARKRERAPDGRFLTKAELEEKRRRQLEASP